MKLVLTRRYFGETYTIGSLSIDGEYLCDTLEDAVRDFGTEGKIAGATSIPFGTYEVVLSQSPRFGRLLPEVLHVPRFAGIRFHRGNTHSDTEGCILVGENTKKGMLTNSTFYENALVEALKLAKDKITLTII